MPHLGPPNRAPGDPTLADWKSGRNAAEVPQFIAESPRAEGAVGLVEREPGPDRGLVYDDHRHAVDMRFRSRPVRRQSANRGRGRLDHPITGISTDPVDKKRRGRRTQEEDLRGLLVLLNVVEQRNGHVRQCIRECLPRRAVDRSSRPIRPRNPRRFLREVVLATKSDSKTLPASFRPARQCRRP